MPEYISQRTLAKTVSCNGVGVHSGKEVTLTLKPAPANHGIKFIRTDLPDNPGMRALFNMVVDTSMATVIGQEGVIVSTIEHLMAAFSGLAIDNAIVEIDSYEMPIMDGSAATFTESILEGGFEELPDPRYFFAITKPLKIENGGKIVEAVPSESYIINCTIDFDHPLIKTQTCKVNLSRGEFAEKISNARTFGFYHEVEFLKKYGLARGATLDTGIALEGDGILNKEGLRFKDEFVRHKTLDCVGDFALLGMPILGEISTFKSGHAFNNEFLRELFAQKDSWETKMVEKI